MLSYIARRLFLLFFVLFGVVTVVFFLIHLIPGDPVDIMLGDNALPGDRQALRHDLGLDEPLHVQYRNYLARVIRGDLGRSIHSRKPVLSEIMDHFPASAELMGGAMVVALSIAFPLGIAAALRPGTFLDGIAMLTSFLGVAIPTFWLGPLLILLFAIQLDWLPVNERGGPEHLVLPSLTLGISLAAMLSRMVRASLLEVLGEDYMRTARAKGLFERTVILKHAMRNALIPVITVVGLQVGALLSGAIITESIFDWPGLGSLMIHGIYNRNYTLVQGCILFIAVIYVAVNLLSDIAYAMVDPRVRLH